MAVVIGGLLLWSRTERANAIGEGVFSLDKPAYSTPEGTAVTVGVNRVNGGTLTADIDVTLTLVGGTAGIDYPSAATTKIAQFKAGTNVSYQSVQFQTLNQNKMNDVATPPISVSILSVTGGGGIGFPASAPLTIQGRGTPRITGVSPKSGGTLGVVPATIVTITGENYAAAGGHCATAPGQAVPNPQSLPGAPVVRCALSVDWYATSNPVTPVARTIPTVLGPTQITTPLPAAGLVNGTTYDLHVTIGDPGLTTAPFVSQSPVTSGDQFTYTTGPAITNIFPANGPVAGGSIVTITGTGFVNGATAPTCPTTVWFGGALATIGTCTAISATTFTIVTPPGTTTGSVDVTAFFGAPWASTTPATPQTKFNYTGAPSVTSITPSSGTSAGGTLVTIIGTGFNGVGCTAWTPPGPPPGSSGVKFGTLPALACSVTTDTQMIAVAPPNVGIQQVTVTNNATGSSAFTTAANFTYVAGPVVVSLDPSSGPPQGGAVVKIAGSGFAPGATVSFGGTPAAFVSFQSSTLLQVTAPAGTGTVDVTVTVGGVTSPATPNDLFSYSIPVVTTIVPNAGPPAGGTVVTINGANFTNGATVQFGTLTVSSVFVSPLQLQATAPAAAAQGVVDVRVTTPNGQSAISAGDIFTYTSGPIISAINPGSGPTTGGIPVVITGTNFAAGATVMFGTRASDVVNFNSATQITALLPAVAAAGPVDVRVTTSVSTSPVSTLSKFTYNLTVPVVTAVSPDKGPTAGGQTVQITGVGFLGVTCPDGVKFGTLLAASCVVNGDTSITAVSPPNVPGQTFLTVTSSSGTSEIALNYTYHSSSSSGSGSGSSGTGAGGAVPGGNLPPPTGAPVTYQLDFRWTLLVWRGADGINIASALRGSATTPVNGVNPTDITGRISAIYGWDPAGGTWLAYFPGTQVPGASNMQVLTRGGVYWVALAGPGLVSWSTTDG
jgi:hypothetical protein